MSDYDARMLTHLRTYRRLLHSENERLKALAHLADEKHRISILRHLRTIRLATRDLEDLLTKAQPKTAVPARPAAF